MMACNGIGNMKLMRFRSDKMTRKSRLPRVAESVHRAQPAKLLLAVGSVRFEVARYRKIKSCLQNMTTIQPFGSHVFVSSIFACCRASRGEEHVGRPLQPWVPPNPF